ncbi:helix-turn-helix domain-containing protein [Pedobacter gandavensis]|uniref:helix-turn-helix domain-containing protein n=1 Tax=Pedobacter gandavensis TaxID=2679963 RepID=UPI00292EB588|nr:helix-turn-helix domain-containing protein [Pedobacter gandavensis]
MKNSSKPIIINSISELHRITGIEKPLHPMISLISFGELPTQIDLMGTKVVLNLYSIFLKRNQKGKLQYGQNIYDFDKGILGMTAPGQLLSTHGQYEAQGWWLIFHPDFIQGYPLTKSVNKYDFFSSSVNEALHLSAKEETLIENIFQNIAQEYNTLIDIYSQDVMVSQLELLLNYTNRYYSRQFITGKTNNQTIITKFEVLLSDYFKTKKTADNRLPNVQYFSSLLYISSHHLSDILRKYTGQNTQQHIHNRIIELAKEKLSTTDLSVSEIAYELGFEHSQSFSKLFKSKTNQSPLKFRRLFY